MEGSPDHDRRQATRRTVRATDPQSVALLASMGGRVSDPAVLLILPLSVPLDFPLTFGQSLAMPPTPEKVREDRLRRMAQRQGLTVQKSRRRDPLALDYGAYYVMRGSDCLESPGNLDELEEFLTTRQSVQRGLAHSAAGETHDLGDFTQYAKPDTEEPQP